MVRLGDPAFAALRRIGSVAGPGREDDAARHIAIEAENYMALELLAHAYITQTATINVSQTAANTVEERSRALQQSLLDDLVAEHRRSGDGQCQSRYRWPQA